VLKQKRVQSWLFLAAGALLGYVAASGNFRLGQQANAAASNELPASATVQATHLVSAQAGEQKEVVVFTVRLPASAVLQIDDDKTKETGQVRTFQTPPLPKGRHYTYTLKATYQGKEVTRQIRIASGVDNIFDLREEFRQSAGRAEGKAPLTAAEAAAIGKEAYLYGYSLITTEVTRVQMSNVANIEGFRGPMGQFVNVKRYPPADYRGVSAPNADTLYSVAWLDLGAEPIVFSHPDMSQRYYLFEMVDLWMTIIETPGARTAGGKARNYLVTGPGWQGTVPEGMKQIKSPTRYLVILGRTYADGTEKDYDIVNALQAQFTLTPLSTWGKPYTPVAPPVNPKPGFSMTDKPQAVINAMDTSTYFNMMARLMGGAAPPAKEDAPILARMFKMGLVPGKPFDLSKLDADVQSALKDINPAVMKLIEANKKDLGRIQDGWVITEGLGRYGTHYLKRAVVAAFGWPANLEQDAVYPYTDVDSNGKTLSGANQYTLTFAKGQTPPVKGFWSFTMYEIDGGWWFVPNMLNKFTVSPRNDLQYNSDGSLTLYFRHESPGKNKEANWLPAPKGNFILMLRMYWPSEKAPSILDGTWKIPPVKMVGK
jgi:uncharacterized protein (TIGR03000 family)